MTKDEVIKELEEINRETQHTVDRLIVENRLMRQVLRIPPNDRADNRSTIGEANSRLAEWAGKRMVCTLSDTHAAYQCTYAQVGPTPQE